MKNLFAIIWILILCKIEGIHTMYIYDNKTIPEEICQTIPENSLISCKQYIIPDQSYCTEEKLEELFPGIYTIPDPKGTSWPGPIQDHKTINGSTHTWGVPKDGSVEYLRGFQIIQKGTDMMTFGTKKCSIIDLSGTENFRSLMETMFAITLTGSYLVDITALPLPQVKQPTKKPEVQIQPYPHISVYHPVLNVTIQYLQVNISTLNISVNITPEVKHLDSMDVQVFYLNGSLIQNTTRSFNITQKSFTINDIGPGNYRLKLIPVDPFLITPNYDTDCICYYDNRTCTPCTGYTVDICVNDTTNTTPIPETENNVFISSIIPVISVCVVMVILFIICRIFIRNQTLSSCLYKSRSFNTTGTDLTEDKIPVLHIIYTNDHPYHKNVVCNLATLLKNSTNYDVIVETSSLKELKTNSIGSLDMSDEINYHRKQCHNADVIIIIHSEWACKLKSVIESGDINIVDITDMEDKSFLLCINEIFQNSGLISKLVSIRFEYTHEGSVIREPFLGPQFNLPSNIDALVKHLRSKVSKQQQQQLESGTMPNKTEDTISMYTSINGVYAYQNRHKSWLFTKLFNLKNYSSDDSGIVLPRPKCFRTRSIRSRSADTLPQHSCMCDTNNEQNLCQEHFRKVNILQRTYSCDLSFCPPESITDEISERFSLLETRLWRVNSRYTRIVNNEIEYDEIITVDELST